MKTPAELREWAAAARHKREAEYRMREARAVSKLLCEQYIEQKKFSLQDAQNLHADLIRIGSHHGYPAYMKACDDHDENLKIIIKNTPPPSADEIMAFKGKTKHRFLFWEYWK